VVVEKIVKSFFPAPVCDHLGVSSLAFRRSPFRFVPSSPCCRRRRSKFNNFLLYSVNLQYPQSSVILDNYTTIYIGAVEIQ